MWVILCACVWVKVILSYESIYLTFHFFILETFAPFLIIPSFEHALHSHDLILISLYNFILFFNLLDNQLSSFQVRQKHMAHLSQCLY